MITTISIDCGIVNLGICIFRHDKTYIRNFTDHIKGSNKDIKIDFTPFELIHSHTYEIGKKKTPKITIANNLKDTLNKLSDEFGPFDKCLVEDQKRLNRTNEFIMSCIIYHFSNINPRVVNPSIKNNCQFCNRSIKYYYEEDGYKNRYKINKKYSIMNVCMFMVVYEYIIDSTHTLYDDIIVNFINNDVQNKDMLKWKKSKKLDDHQCDAYLQYINDIGIMSFNSIITTIC